MKRFHCKVPQCRGKGFKNAAGYSAHMRFLHADEWAQMGGRTNGASATPYTDLIRAHSSKVVTIKDETSVNGAIGLGRDYTARVEIYNGRLLIILDEQELVLGDRSKLIS